MYPKLNYSMVYYSFDLSYHPAEGVTDTDIHGITDKYTSCEWYGSDMEPFYGNKNKITRKCTKSNCYNIYDITQLKNLIREVSETEGIFFNYVCKYENDDCEPVDIYYHPSKYTQIAEPYRSEYDARIKNLTDDDFEIHQLAKFGECIY